MPTKTDRVKVPKFATEAEEAEWWDAHQDMVEADLRAAIHAGTAEHGAAQRLAREARERQAAKKGNTRKSA